jgi:hypothetical protein
VCAGAMKGGGGHHHSCWSQVRPCKRECLTADDYSSAHASTRTPNAELHGTTQKESGARQFVEAFRCSHCQLPANTATHRVTTVRDRRKFELIEERHHVACHLLDCVSVSSRGWRYRMHTSTADALV